MLTQTGNLPIDEEAVAVALSGQMLLETPLLNKGSVFPEEAMCCEQDDDDHHPW